MNAATTAQTPADVITDLYDTQLAEPLKQVIRETYTLLPMLLTLSDADKNALTALTREEAAKRSRQEAFLHPETLSTLPVLFRNIVAFDDFLRAAKAKKNGLTPIETAVASLRWETFDQFRACVSAIAAAAPNLPKGRLVNKNHAAIAKHAQTILDNVGAIQNLFGGAALDTVFTEATDALNGISSSAISSAPDTIVTRLSAPLKDATNAAAELVSQLRQLSDSDRKSLTALMQEYAPQCTLSEQPNLNDIIRSLPAAVKNAQALENIFNRLTQPKVSEFSTGDQHTAYTAAEISNALRAPVRALNALLQATNKTKIGDHAFNPTNYPETGKYDKLLALSSQITAACWKFQGILAEKGFEELQSAVMNHRAAPITSPSTTLSDTTVTQISSTIPGHERG
jgi:hypothetical protein